MSQSDLEPALGHRDASGDHHVPGPHVPACVDVSCNIWYMHVIVTRYLGYYHLIKKFDLINLITYPNALLGVPATNKRKDMVIS